MNAAEPHQFKAAAAPGRKNYASQTPVLWLIFIHFVAAPVRARKAIWLLVTITRLHCFLKYFPCLILVTFLRDFHSSVFSSLYTL
jgi:hypothetical protein